MFVAFQGAPMILRLYGKGRTLLPNTPEWEALEGRFDLLPGARQMIHAHIHAVKTSCGFSVPFFDYTGERETLKKWAEQKGEQGLDAYRQQKNATSMDGILTSLGHSFKK